MAAFSDSSSMDPEPAGLAQDVHRLFEDLARSRPDRRSMAGECVPPVDVFETDRTVEIVLDLPGVAADALRVLIKGGFVLIVGEKERSDATKLLPASFHLVERHFGRFARAVRVTGAVDTAGARARLSQGELRVVLPRREERRGQGMLVPIDTAGSTAPE